MYNLKVIKEMVEEFQCPGCVVGMDTNCGKYKIEDCNDNYGIRCESHCAGTLIAGIGHINLGLPRDLTGL